MATVNLGLIKFRWQGAYAGATAYVKDDVVSYNGSSYVCILASTGNLPTDTTYWNVMAQSGTDITSISGLAQGDILYYNGTDWVRLGAGTSGQVLQTGGSGANPSWVDASSGYVIQEKVGYYNGTSTTSITTQTPQWLGSLNSNYQTASSISITPSSTSNKMHIKWQVPFGGDNYGVFLLYREIGGSGGYTQLSGGSHWGNGTGDPYQLFSAEYWDAPNTTSAIVYRIYAKNHDGTSWNINDMGSTNSIGAGMFLSVKEVDGSKLTIA
jgi:hypothetical protein